MNAANKVQEYRAPFGSVKAKGWAGWREGMLEAVNKKRKVI